MTRTLARILIAGLLVAAALPARADLDFQAVEEWTFLQFRYPDGSFRLLSDGTKISAFSRALSDTSGQGLPFDAYLSYVDEDGDSVGVYIWKNPPPAKYFFVETAGADSLFAAPDFYRMGSNTAPPSSVDSLAIGEGMVLTKHLADSLISSPKFISSGVIRDVHLAANLDGAKLTPGTVPEGAIATGAVTPEKLAAGERYLSAAAGDEVEAQNGYFARIQPAPGGPIEVYGPAEFSLGHDVKSGADLTFESGSSLLASSGATVNLATTVDLGATAQPTTVNGPIEVRGDMDFGASPSHDATFSGAVSVATGLTMGAAGDTTTTHTVTGFLDLSYIEVTLGTATINAVYAFPGATSDMIFVAVCSGAVRLAQAVYETPGHIRIRAASSLSSTPTRVVAFKVH